MYADPWPLVLASVAMIVGLVAWVVFASLG